MKPLNEIHDYWKNPEEKNEPIHYLDGKERTDFLIKQIELLKINNCSILEIGCNVGRNLKGLWDKGYKNLTGIEINLYAIFLMSEKYKEMYQNIKILNGPVESKIEKIKTKSIDVIFTMAVLEHIHNDSAANIFYEMTQIAKKYIITIEDETKISDRHFKRNYKDVFESLGLTEIESFNCKKIKGLGKNYIYRLFKKGGSCD